MTDAATLTVPVHAQRRRASSLPCALLICAFALMALGPLRALLASFSSTWPARAGVVFAVNGAVIVGWTTIVVAIALLERAHRPASTSAFAGLARWTMVGAALLAVASSASLAIQVVDSVSTAAFPNLTNLTRIFLGASAAGWIALTVGLGVAAQRAVRRHRHDARAQPWLHGLPFALFAASVNALAYAGLLLVWWDTALSGWTRWATYFLYGADCVAWLALAAGLLAVFGAADGVSRGRRLLAGLPIAAFGAGLLAVSAAMLLALIVDPLLYGQILRWVYASEFLGWGGLACGATMLAARTLESDPDGFGPVEPVALPYGYR